MAVNTATVETLTAEVRVLMVGSRQVTLSVYRQLDWADPEDEGLELFGRVSDNQRDKYSDPRDLCFVGRTRGGVLVRARASWDDYHNYLDPVEVPGNVFVRPMDRTFFSSLPREQGLKIWRLSERPFQFLTLSIPDRDPWVDRSALPYDAPSTKPTFSSEGYNWLYRQQAGRDESIREWQSLKDLPLIVLAGLR